MEKKNTVGKVLWVWGAATMVLGALGGLIFGLVADIITGLLWAAVALTFGILLIGFSEALELLQSCKDTLIGADASLEKASKKQTAAPPEDKPAVTVEKKEDIVVNTTVLKAGEYKIGIDLDAGKYLITGNGALTITNGEDKETLELFMLQPRQRIFQTGAEIKINKEATFAKLAD